MGEDRVIIKSELDGEGFAKGCDKLTEAISSLDKTVKEIFGNIQKMIDSIDWNKVTESFAKGDFAGAAKEISSAMAKIREEAEKGVNQDDGKSNFFSGIKEKASDAAQAVKKAFGGIKGVMKGLGTALTAPIRLMGTLASKAKVALSGIGKAVGNVTNGLRKMLGGTKSAFSGVIGNVARLAPMLLGAASVYQALTKSVNAYMAENEKLQQRLNSIWTALGNVIGPIIEKFVNWITTAVSYLLSFLKMLGITSKSASELSKKTSKAGAEMKKTLAGFDELNVLNDNSSGGGNAGLEDKEAPQWIKDIADFLKQGEWAKAGEVLANKLNEMVDSVDWEGIGKKVGYYMNGVLTFLATAIYKFDWHNLGEKFASSINEILYAVDWTNLGKLIAAKFYALFGFLTGFLEKLDFAAVAKALSDVVLGALDGIASAIAGADGQKIGAGIRAFFENIKWDEIAESIGRLLKEAWDFALELLWGLLGGESQEKPPLVKSLEELGEAISKFWDDVKPKLEGLWKNVLEPFINWLANSALPDVISSIAEGISQLGDVVSGNMSIGEFFSNLAKDILGFGTTLCEEFGKIDFSAMAQSLWDGFDKLIKDVDWAGLAESAATFLGTALGTVAGSMAEFFVTFFQNLWGSVTTAWGSVKDYFNTEIENAGGNVIEGFFNGIIKAIGEIAEWIMEHIVNPFLDGFRKGFDMHSPSKVMEEFGGLIIEGLLNGLKTAWDSIMAFLNPNIEEIKQKISGAWDGLKEKTAKKWEEIKGDIGTVWSAIKGTVSKTTEEVEKVTGVSWSDIKGTVSSAVENIKTVAIGAWDAINGDVSAENEEIESDNTSTWNDVESTIDTTLGNIKGTAETSWNSVKTSTTNALNQINTTNKSSMSQVEAAQKSSWNNVRTIATTSAQSMSSSVGGIFRSLASQAYGWGSDLCANIANGIYSAYSWVTNAVSSIANTIYSYLHFSEPDKGPLSNFHTFMPDMMRMMADGIKDNTHLAADAASGVAEAVSEEIQDGDFHFGVEANAEMGDFMTTFSDKIVQGFSDLISRLESLTERINFAMPTVAEGSFLPYGVGGGQNAFGASGEDGFISRLSSSIYDAVSSALMDTQGSGGQRIAVLNVNGREFCRATFYDQQAVVREHGISFINNG